MHDEKNPEKVITRTFKSKGYTNVKGVPELVEEFKAYYLEERKIGRTDSERIFREYRHKKHLNDKIWFNPTPAVIRGMFTRFEKDLPVFIRTITIKKPDVDKKNKSEKPKLLKEIAYHDLEDGAKNLQAMLIEDAADLLKESNEKYEGIDANGGMWSSKDWEQMRVRKKALALAVTKEVLGSAQKHQLIQIKKNKEGRETAGFLMDLIQKSTSGEMSDEELEMLETAAP